MRIREHLSLTVLAAAVILGGCDGDPPEAGTLVGEEYQEGLLNVMGDEAELENGEIRPDSGAFLPREENPQPAGTFDLEPGAAVDPGPVDIDVDP